MQMNQQVKKPIHRGKLRMWFGKEYFMLKRKISWYVSNTKFAKQDHQIHFDQLVIQHKSLLLRPLKDVEMYLQHNKVKNLQLAIGSLDAIIINPGETFSIWKNVGRTTKIKGYLKGMALHNGKVSQNTGGGLCQLGNLLYWMVLHTPLTITERWRHGFDVFPDINRTIPFACGATLAYNYIDFQFKNNTPHRFQIKLWLDKTHLNGEIMCNTDLKTTYKIFETDHFFTQQWWGGYTRHNKIWKRKTSHLDKTITEELVSENNAIMMYNPLLQERF